MAKNFRELRVEAAELNAQALASGQPEPIPELGTLRSKPLAKAVIQTRLNNGWNQTQDTSQE
jgi:hypothetical protein